MWQIVEWPAGPRSKFLYHPGGAGAAVCVGTFSGGVPNLVAPVYFQSPRDRAAALDDARLIVRGVNNHVPLRSALRACVEAMEGQGCAAAALQQARKAMAL